MDGFSPLTMRNSTVVRLFCVHLTAVHISKDDGKELDMVRSGGMSFLAAKHSKLSLTERSKRSGTQSCDSSSCIGNGLCGTPGPAAGATLDGDGGPAMRIKVPTSPATPSAGENAACNFQDMSLIEAGAKCAIAARAADKPHFEGAATRNR